MKTRPDLLLRDALAAAFVRAAAGDAAARSALEELSSWEAATGPGPGLRELRAEDGAALFKSDGSLTQKFSGLEDYVRDRARRFGPALAWIQADRATGKPIACARAAWDAGLFFEVHELLEPVWMHEHGERRRVLQGLIMAGAALHHLTQDNLAGARGLLREAAQRLADASPQEPFDLARFGRELAALAELIENGQVKHADEIRKLPRLAPRSSH